MALTDPKTGKSARSGAAKARAKKAEQELERKRTDTGALRFENLDKFPIDDPVGAMTWWNNVLGTCADQVMRDTLMPLEQKARMLADFAAKGGMIRDKVKEAHEMRRATQEREKERERSGLEPNVDRSSTPTVPALPRRARST